MPSSKVKTTPDSWRRVATETQESKGHRVHAQKDIEQGWVFVAVRKGDGIHPCKVLGQFEKASEARACCEADEYEFHWAEVKDMHAGLNLKNSAVMTRKRK